MSNILSLGQYWFEVSKFKTLKKDPYIKYKLIVNPLFSEIKSNQNIELIMAALNIQRLKTIL